MAKQNLFALSEETKDKVIKKINEPGAPDTYTIKPGTMREYYSRVWVIGLDKDLPGITYDEQGVPVTQGVEAWILEKSEQDKVDKRYWKNSNVKLKKLVYNFTNKIFPSIDDKEKPIPYIAMQDMLGTIWIQPKNENNMVIPELSSDQDEYPEGAKSYPYNDALIYCDDLDSFSEKDSLKNLLVCNPLGLPPDRPTIIGKAEGFPGAAEDSSGGRRAGEYVAISTDTRDFVILTPTDLISINAINNNSDWILEAGDCIYVTGNINYTRYGLNKNYWSYTQDISAGNCRLVVCQRSVPKGWEKSFRMPFYPLESNIGIPPRVDRFNERWVPYRCGIRMNNPDSLQITDEVWDYVFDNGRYKYEPLFEFNTTAIDPSGLSEVLYYGESDIGGQVTFSENLVAFKFLDNKYYTARGSGPTTVKMNSYYGMMAPDIQSGDTIRVRCDTHGSAGPLFTIIGYPTDFAEGVIIPMYDGEPSQRGWVEATWDETYGQDLGANPQGNYILGLSGFFSYGQLANYVQGQTPEHTAQDGFSVHNAYNIHWRKKTKSGMLV